MKKKPEPPDHVLVEKHREVADSAALPGISAKSATWLECDLCGQRWLVGQQQADRCPGAKIYRWNPWPEGMVTKKQLAAKGLRPGPVAGVIPYSKSADGDGWLRVYRESEATPRPPRSEKQQAAAVRMREAAEAALYCPNCGEYLGRYGSCERCRAESRAEYDRHEAAKDAYDLICGGNFVVWDSETTDLDGRFVEIAVVDNFGKVLFNSRIRPGCLITPGAYNVHHIKDEELPSAPAFYEVYQDLRKVLHRKYWVIYNASFDMGILDRETWNSEYRHYFEHYPIKPSDYTCAMHLYAAWYGEWHGYYKSYTWQPLDFAARRAAIDLPTHSALGDALRTLEVLYELADWYRSEFL
jgi:predicted RNA-binding Zn-ribbon protein involved in translation (DUF1610 family)